MPARECAETRTEQRAAQQHHAVAEVDIALCRGRNADDHGRDRSQCRHERRKDNLSKACVFHVIHLLFILPDPWKFFIPNGFVLFI